MTIFSLKFVREFTVLPFTMSKRYRSVNLEEA